MIAGKMDKHPLLDLDVLLSRQEIGDEFFELLLKTFSSEVPELLGKLKQGLKKHDRNIIRQLCHKLKGMSINIGALSLSKAGQEIEEETYQESFSILEAAIEKLEWIFEQTQTELDVFRKKGVAS